MWKGLEENEELSLQGPASEMGGQGREGGPGLRGWVTLEASLGQDTWAYCSKHEPFLK